MCAMISPRRGSAGWHPANGNPPPRLPHCSTRGTKSNSTKRARRAPSPGGEGRGEGGLRFKYLVGNRFHSKTLRTSPIPYTIHTRPSMSALLRGPTLLHQVEQVSECFRIAATLLLGQLPRALLQLECHLRSLLAGTTQMLKHRRKLVRSHGVTSPRSPGGS